MSAPDPHPSTLRDYLSVVRRRKWLILAVTVLVTGSALALSFLQTPIYEGRARLRVQQDQPIFNNTGASRVDPEYVQTEIQIIEGEAVANVVQERLGTTPKVSATELGLTSVVDVRAQSTSPEKAAEAANAYVEAYLQIRRQAAVDSFEALGRELGARIDGIQQEIDRLSAELAGLPGCSGPNPPAAACSQRDAIQANRDALITQLVPFKQRRDQLQVDASVVNAGTQVISQAVASDEPISPNRVRNTLLGLALGLVAGVGLAFALEYLDDSIRTKDDLERFSRGMPVLGIIPEVSNGRRDEPVLVSRADLSSGAAEAYRILRTSIHFRGLERSLHLLQVTSPGPAEGKTSTVANLGFALARAGERVVMVSCDLRRPRLHSYFGLSNDVGFTSILLGEASIASALQSVPGEENLRLLASGPIPPDPAELLASDEAARLLFSLRDEADTVLVDTPPVLPVTDAVVLSSVVDGTLMVAMQGSTGRKQLARSLEILQQSESRVIGTVFNAVGDDGISYKRSAYYYSSTTSAPR